MFNDGRSVAEALSPAGTSLGLIDLRDYRLTSVAGLLQLNTAADITFSIKAGKLNVGFNTNWQQIQLRHLPQNEVFLVWLNEHTAKKVHVFRYTRF